MAAGINPMDIAVSDSSWNINHLLNGLAAIDTTDRYEQCLEFVHSYDPSGSLHTLTRLNLEAVQGFLRNSYNFIGRENFIRLFSPEKRSKKVVHDAGISYAKAMNFPLEKLDELKETERQEFKCNLETACLAAYLMVKNHSSN